MNIRDRIKELRRVPARELIPNPKNWRRHPAGQIEAVKGVLQEIGYADVLITRELPDGKLMLLDGHLRKDVTPDMAVPVIVTDLDESESDKVLATLDPLAAMAEKDDEALKTLLKGIQFEEPALKEWTSTLVEMPREPLVEPPAQIDKAEELRQKWQVEKGQLWEIGPHRLLCGDSTQQSTLATLMDTSTAALIFTDPPYGVAYDGGTTKRRELDGDTNTDLYLPACCMARDFSDVHAALYLWHAGVKGIAAAAAAAAAGWVIRCELVWNKNLAQFGALSAQYHQKHEPAYYCYKKGQTPRWYGPTTEITVWDCPRASVNEYHPTQKPVELAARAIRNSSRSQEIVLDLFAGSGSTLLAAAQCDRMGFGIEIDPGYVAVTLQRLADLGLSPKLVSG